MLVPPFFSSGKPIHLILSYSMFLRLFPSFVLAPPFIETLLQKSDWKRWIDRPLMLQTGDTVWDASPDSVWEGRVASPEKGV